MAKALPTGVERGPESTPKVRGSLAGRPRKKFGQHGRLGRTSLTAAISLVVCTETRDSVLRLDRIRDIRRIIWSIVCIRKMGRRAVLFSGKTAGDGRGSSSPRNVPECSIHVPPSAPCSYLHSVHITTTSGYYIMLKVRLRVVQCMESDQLNRIRKK